MRSEEYRRIYQACINMALQSKSRHTRAHWLKIAKASLDCSRDADDALDEAGGDRRAGIRANACR